VLLGCYWLIACINGGVITWCCVAGDYIKDKYDGATEVRVNRRGRLQIRDPRFNKPTANDLVYIDDSPNYCIRNMSVGSLGKHSSPSLFLSSLLEV
jgi:hypothetical protein